MNNKTRLDQYLVELGKAPTREKAKGIIMAGIVYVDNQKADKAGLFIKPDAKVEVHGKTLQYVSRGGLKLEKAIDVFSLNLKDKIAMDIGASTGGFTDCMLQNGAKKVYAVDVGYGQLDWKLRNDERVINLERTNIRYVTKEQVPDSLDFVSVDVAFISLLLVIPAFYDLLKENAEACLLIKPQFEAGREKVGKKGVIKDPNVHIEVCNKVIDFCEENGLGVLGLDYSPVKGPEGNIEYLLYVQKKMGAPKMEKSIVDHVILDSHNELG